MLNGTSDDGLQGPKVLGVSMRSSSAIQATPATNTTRQRRIASLIRGITLLTLPVPWSLGPRMQARHSSCACLVKLHLPHGFKEVILHYSHLIECDGATLLGGHPVIQRTHFYGAEFCLATNQVPHVQHLQHNMTCRGLRQTSTRLAVNNEVVPERCKDIADLPFPVRFWVCRNAMCQAS